MTKTTQERKRGLVWPLASKEGVYSGGGGSGWPRVARMGSRERTAPAANMEQRERRRTGSRVGHGLLISAPSDRLPPATLYLFKVLQLARNGYQLGTKCSNTCAYGGG